MRIMHEQGMTQEAIAAVFGVGRNTVRYAIDDEYRIYQRKQASERNKRVRRERRAERVEAATVGVPVYEGGDPWIEDRKVWACGPSKRNGYKCAGKGGKQEPKPERKRQPVGIIAATDAHLRGDREALAAYLVSVGRDSLAINTGDDDGTGLGRD
jgi:hypothetical protein